MELSTVMDENVLQNIESKMHIYHIKRIISRNEAIVPDRRLKNNPKLKNQCSSSTVAHKKDQAN